MNSVKYIASKRYARSLDNLAIQIAQGLPVYCSKFSLFVAKVKSFFFLRFIFTYVCMCLSEWMACVGVPEDKKRALYRQL